MVLPYFASMGKRKPVDIHINLALKDQFFSTLGGKVLQWALSVGRYIVIFTELVVILSFVTRFSLDRQVTDLNGSIEQKRRVIESYGSLEDDFRILQQKIEDYKQVEQVSNIAEVFPDMVKVTPIDLKLDSLTIQFGTVIFSGQVLSRSSLNLLINNMQLSDGFSNIVINKIETAGDTSPGYKFNLRANTRTKPAVTKVSK